MAAAMQVNRCQTKSHDKPDEVRAPDQTRVEVVRLQGYTIGRLIFQPGWRWSQCVNPVVHTGSCQVAHVGYSVSGRVTVRMNDGTQTTTGPGTSHTIPPEARLESDRGRSRQICAANPADRAWARVGRRASRVGA
jgi:hypothetical protein